MPALSIDPAALRERFAENFSLRGELGASVSIWQNGQEVVSLSHGWRDRQQTAPWDDDTLVLVWSATKGLAAACLLHVLATDGIPLETPVAALWLEFAANGKGAVTLAQLLSHRAGLAAMDDLSPSILDHAAVAAALAAQAPNWPLDASSPARTDTHGYHARTYGFLLDELIRRLRPGQTLGQYWRETFAKPLGLDFWIGLPDEQAPRVAPVYPARSTGNRPIDEFYDALADEHSFTRRVFAGPRGLHSVASMNTPEARQASLPSLGGIGSARALGKFYAMLANGGALDGQTFFPPEALSWMTTRLVNGPDRTLIHDTAFSVGLMLDPLVGVGERKRRAIFGPALTAFGQPGAGGSHAFADPENNVAFAYVMNQMELGVMPNDKALSLVAALYDPCG